MSMRSFSRWLNDYGHTLHYIYLDDPENCQSITGNLERVLAWYPGAGGACQQSDTRGMSQSADGGLMVSKPYTSSGQYIRRMGDYCGSCRYNPNLSTEPNVCQFNSLYWHFHDRHERLLNSNVCLAMVYRNWDHTDRSKREALLFKAEALS